MSGRCCCCSSAADSAYATRACVCVGACCARYRNWSWGLKTEELHAYDDEMCCVVATAQLPYIDRHRQNNGEYGRRSAHAPYRRWTGSGCVCVCGGHTGISWRLSWQISFCIYIYIYINLRDRCTANIADDEMVRKCLSCTGYYTWWAVLLSLHHDNIAIK